MSLFPAYSTHDTNETEKNELQWLKNSSCPANIAITQQKKIENNIELHQTDSIKDNVNEKESRISQESDEDSDSSDGSFKRKRSPSSSNDQPPKHKKYKKHKKHKTHKHRKKSRRRSRSYSRERNIPKTNEIQLPLKNGNTKIFLGGLISTITAQDVLYLDLTGEQTNFAFDSTHYSQTVNYKKRKLKVPLGGSVNRKSSSKQVRYFKGSFGNLSESRYISCVYKNEDPFARTREFIRVSHGFIEESCVSSSSSSLANPLGILDSSTANYVSGVANPESQQSPSAIQYSYWQEKIKDFNTRLAKEPQNVDLWLEFIRFQDAVAGAGAFIGSEEVGEKTSKKKYFAQNVERKLSIVESAIKKNFRSLPLRFERLQIGEDVWSKEELMLEWNKLLSNFPNILQVWHRFIICCQTNFLVYSLRSATNSHIKCSTKLIQMQTGQFLSHKPPPDIGFHLINLTTQLAFLWQQGGYMERTIALFQALLEFNLFCPQYLRQHNVSFEEKLALFEAFWDTRAPRFGEVDSIGWAEFMMKKEAVIFNEEILEGTQDEEDVILSKGGPKSKLWIELESSREESHWLPWQQDPENCEDPERMVSFMDIKKHMLEISNENENFYLIINFLSFLKVTIPESVMQKCFSGLDDSLFLSLRLETLRELRFPNRDQLESREGDDHLFFFPCVGPSVQKPPEAFYQFVCRVIDKSMSLFGSFHKQMLAVVQIRLFRDRCLLLKESNSEQFVLFVSTCKKKIKQLMKQQEFRNDLDIYFEYALFESSLGLVDSAVKIHQMSLTARLGSGNLFESDQNVNLAVAFRHLLAVLKLEFLREKETRDCSQMNVVQNLTCSVLTSTSLSFSKSAPSGPLTLRAKNKALEARNFLLKNPTLGCPQSLSCVVFLLAILQLFTAGFKSCCLIFEEVLEQLGDNSIYNLKARELIFENYVWLAELAPSLSSLSCSPLSPASMRSLIAKAVQAAPNNLFLLGKLSQCKFQVWRDINSKINKIDATDDSSILAVIFQLIPHIRRSVQYKIDEGGDSLNNQLMSILETSVNTAKGKHCPLLWRLYLRLIHSVRPQNLNKFVYRAIHNCPSAKCVYMDCIRLLPSCTHEMLRLMEEKGIRIRLPLEELDVLLENEVVEEDTSPQGSQSPKSETRFTIDSLPEITIETVAME